LIKTQKILEDGTIVTTTTPTKEENVIITAELYALIKSEAIKTDQDLLDWFDLFEEETIP
jgi:hypothetical protein